MEYMIYLCFTFRQGLPEDYITRQMTIPYDITLTTGKS